jgi:hypothetical protein
MLRALLYAARCRPRNLFLFAPEKTSPENRPADGAGPIALPRLMECQFGEDLRFVATRQSIQN